MILPYKNGFLTAADRLGRALGGPVSEITYIWEEGRAAVTAAAGDTAAGLEEGAGTLRILDGGLYRYLCFLPPGCDPEDTQRRWPLILFFHGIGERGSDAQDLLRRGLPRCLAQGKRVDAIVLAPQCPADSHWVNDGRELEKLSAWIPRMAEAYPVDPDRMYVTGLSMGGRCCWKLLLAMPKMFAAAAIVCGRTNTYDFGEIRELPLWLFHGAGDDVIPFENINLIMPPLLESGRRHTRLTVYPYLGHDVWTAAYGRADLYAWLLAQSLEGRRT